MLSNLATFKGSKSPVAVTLFDYEKLFLITYSKDPSLRETIIFSQERHMSEHINNIDQFTATSNSGVEENYRAVFSIKDKDAKAYKGIFSQFTDKVRAYENYCEGELPFIQIYDYNNTQITTFDADGNLEVLESSYVEMLEQEVTELNLQAKLIDNQVLFAYTVKFGIRNI